MGNAEINSLAILTYHSISNDEGPTSIPPDVFRMQMKAIAELGVDAIGLDDVERWMKGEASLSRPSIAITFDDAFQDFADAAFPVLQEYGFRSCVFVPTDLAGGAENWEGANIPPRALMEWTTIRELSAAGVDFGSHSCRHRDLVKLSENELEDDLAASRRELENAISRETPHFAPPYGGSNERVIQAIARHYSLSVGVRLDRARRTSPIHDLPRIEMHYYRDEARWRAFLAGRDALYFTTRRALRGAREFAESAVGSLRRSS